MRDLINFYYFRELDELYITLINNTTLFLVDARSLVAVLILIYLSVKAYGIMTGDEEFQILPLVRPFAIAMVVLLWGQFITLLSGPMDILESKSQVASEAQIGLVNGLYRTRNQLYTQLYTRIWAESAEIEDVQEENGFFPSLPSIEEFKQKLYGAAVFLQAKIKWALFGMIEYVAIAFFQAMMYLIFFLKAIMAALLSALGPFAFAISIIPAFKKAYVKWLSRYIGVLLYGVMGYIVLIASLTLVQNALTREIESLVVTLGSGPNSDVFFDAYVLGTNGSETSFIIAMIIGSIGMFSVPIISNWIISGASAAQVAGKGLKAVQQTAKAPLALAKV